MNKKEIKNIAKKCFDLGKGDVADRLFDEYFEKYYKEEAPVYIQIKEV